MKTFPEQTRPDEIQDFLSADGSRVQLVPGFENSAFISHCIRFFGQPIDTSKYSDLELACFYANAYNSLLLHEMTFMIKKYDGNYTGHTNLYRKWYFFYWRKIQVNGEKISMSTLENKLLRPLCTTKLNDSRVHFLINCASKSCPKLPTEWLTPENWARIADENAHAFLHNDIHGCRIDVKENTLYVSSIFKWFQQGDQTQNSNYSGVADFVETDASIVDFVGRFVDLAQLRDPQVKFLVYDWSTIEAAVPPEKTMAALKSIDPDQDATSHKKPKKKHGNKHQKKKRGRKNSKK